MNMLEAAARFALAAHEVRAGELEGLEKAAKIVEDEAKRAIGTYDFGWPPLGPAAVAKHGDTPLLDTGALRDSIEHSVEGRSAFVGTNSVIGVYQNFGTSRGIPPRPFLLPAALRKEEEICKAVGDAVFKML